MKEKKVIDVRDLGPGEGGKGGVVHTVCGVKRAHTVLKVGGCQGNHGVHTANGQHFNFRQFGCGTFEGVRTHLSPLFVAEPYRLLVEAERLMREWGIRDIFDYMTVDEDVLLVTPFHTSASRLRELARKDKPKGTVGVGSGEAMLDAEMFPDTAVRVRDIGKASLREKLTAIRERKLVELAEIVANVDTLRADDRELANDDIELLQDGGFVDRIVATFDQVGSLVKVVDREYLRRNILGRDGVVVVESSNGILTDRYHGFHPNTSRLRTLPSGVLGLLKECGYDGEVVKLGVTRAYAIRHGAGPMVTACPEMMERLLPGSNKDENRWQGRVRMGPLDFVALRYAVNVCGGPEAFDGLAVTWFDQITEWGKWKVCDSYAHPDAPEFFTSEGEIKVRRGNDSAQLEHQAKLGELLYGCRPNLTTYDIPKGTGEEELVALCKGTFQEKLGVPVRLISFGPTEDDKVCI